MTRFGPCSRDRRPIRTIYAGRGRMAAIRQL